MLFASFISPDLIRPGIFSRETGTSSMLSVSSACNRADTRSVTRYRCRYSYSNPVRHKNPQLYDRFRKIPCLLLHLTADGFIRISPGSIPPPVVPRALPPGAFCTA